MLERPAWFPIPGFMLKLFLGEVSALVIRGRRVVPKKALELGYQFQYPDGEKALRDLHYSRCLSLEGPHPPRHHLPQSKQNQRRQHLIVYLAVSTLGIPVYSRVQ